MNTSQINLNAQLKKEADEILYKQGLMDLLYPFGTPHIQGSYSLDLMTWRDLDIYLQTDTVSEIDFFLLGQKVCSAFAPVKMSFRNELIAKTKGLPCGLYWGIYLGNERAGAWKIDIWAVSSSELQKLAQYNIDIKQKLTPAMAQSIMDIKSQCWQDLEYRRSYSSSDIYAAVLENNVVDVQGFKNYLEKLSNR